MAENFVYVGFGPRTVPEERVIRGGQTMERRGGEEAMEEKRRCRGKLGVLGSAFLCLWKGLSAIGKCLLRLR